MADTIEIVQGTATVVEVAGPTGPQGPAGAAGATGAQGPQGVPGTGLEVLTTQGDILYQGASTGQRLPIGATGQVLKVAGGVPTWANESGAVSSVAGKTGVVTLDKNDVGLGNVTNAAQVTSVTGTAPISSSGGTTPAISISAATTSAAGSMSAADKTKLDGIAAGAEVNVNADWNASSGDAQILNKPSTFAPSAHSSSHAAGGSDPLAPSDIGAQSIFTSESITLSGDTTLSAARAKIWTVNSFSTNTRTITLPTSAVSGDVAIVRAQTILGNVEIVSGSTLATMQTGAIQQNYRFVYTSSWALDPVTTHGHFASQIISGTLTHERGGLEADVSAYSGLVKISGGSTSAVTVTSAGEALLDDADAAAQRTTLGLGTAATSATGDFAAASHSHELTALAATGATNGHVLTANGSNGATFAALPASGVSSVASSASDVLGVSGANITGVDANADRIVYWNNTSNKLAYGTPADAGAAAASHTHTSADINSQTASNGHVLTANGSGGASFAALPASGISNVDSTLADVMSVSGSNLVADDGGLVDSSNPALVWDDAAGKAVWANPLRRTAAGAFYVGVAPTTTALGTRAINIQADRSVAADRVAQGTDCVVVGNSAQTGNISAATAIGFRARATSTYATCIGGESLASGNSSIAIGAVATASGAQSINISAYDAYFGNSSTATNSVGLNATADLRAMFATAAFRAVYWGGQTTNNTATILNLDATATNRFTIAASTALAVDILLVARRSDTQDKWLVARRFLGIRRDGSNNTSLIGAVQTLGTDQSEGSPTWTFALTADDTNEALQLEVTGAASETIQWRATAFYRVA